MTQASGYSLGPRRDILANPNINITESLERSLYHGGSVLTESDCTEGRKACFDCMLRQILLVRDSPNNIGSAVLTPGEEVRTYIRLNFLLFPLFIDLFSNLIFIHENSVNFS